jgi:long-subunit acyl-CoA synthetase (AMP-forming)
MGQRHTLVHQIFDWAEKKPDTPVLFEKNTQGDWRSLTWKEYEQRVRAIAKGLIALGHQKGDCVAIVGDNRIDWVLCQFGIMAARGLPAPIYTTNTDSQTAYIVNHSRSKIAICDKKSQLDKYLKASNQGEIQTEKFITMDEIPDQGDSVMSLSALEALGTEQDDTELNQRLSDLTDEESALLIYTSGTTGVPKAVELNHGGMIFVGDGLTAQFEFLQEEGNYRSLSYLPLCHVAEQIFTNIACLNNGGSVYFCPDLKLLKEYLPGVRPTVFLGVPRVWEKFEAALKGKLSEATGIKAKLAAWALKTEFDAFKTQVAAGKPFDSFKRKLANKLVVSKIKTKLGLDALMVAATGAAPIKVETQEFFASLGICIYEGYGMSETSGVATVNDAHKPAFGSVGKPLNGVEVKIADDGEILLKGRNMTRGYLYMPEKTAELIDDEDWIHTGDLGEIGPDGNLKITGRKKDLIITAGGKNIAPAEMEAHIKTITGIGQAVVVGDNQPYLSALVALDIEEIEDLCKRVGISASSTREASQDPKVRDFFESEIEEKCNKKVGRWQTIKKFEILPEEFSVETGELTPTLKVKRNEVNKKFSDKVAAFYEA